MGLGRAAHGCARAALLALWRFINRRHPGHRRLRGHRPRGATVQL